ncbi:hypothetical protein A2U01_0066981, partial [Trifolium medium]|nr:hypothetical protein [Trifolium medium]
GKQRNRANKTTTQEAMTNQENGEGGELIGMAENQPSRPLQRRPSKRPATMTATATEESFSGCRRKRE